MQQEIFQSILAVKDQLIVRKEPILNEWVSEQSCSEILLRHEIDSPLFVREYASNVFDYFMGVVSGEVELGRCPVMAELIDYLKNRDLRADELFTLCTNFKKSVLNATYQFSFNSQELFNAISYLFDQNFSSLLGLYTDTIFQKEQEIDKNVKLLGEYKNAIDESAIVAMTDSSGSIIYVNDNLSKICGYQPDELIGHKHSIMRHPDMSGEFFEGLWKTIQSGKVFKGTFKDRKKDGGHFYIDNTIVPIKDPMSGEVEYISIGYDVTQLIDATEKAIEAGKAKEYFLSNMSHEIRTPMNAILGFVSLLKDEVKSQRQQKYLDIIENSGENLLYIINDILDFSKLQNGEFALDPHPFSIHDEIAHTMELFVPSANVHNITITSFISPSIPKTIIADPLRITQILGNFLSNAIKFSSNGGNIHVQVSIEESWLQVSVRDYGKGILKADQERIFDAFSQAQGGKGLGGTGLGLSICRQLSEKMGGTIRLESEVGKGSIFTLHIPIEIEDYRPIVKMDVGMFKKLSFGFLKPDPSEWYKLESIQKYWEFFDLDIHEVEEITGEYDLLVFLDNSIDSYSRQSIIDLGVPAIAIMDYLDRRYDDISTIIPLTFPIYCSKIQQAISEALGIENTIRNPQKHVLYNEQRYHGDILVVEDNSANQELIKILLERFGLSYTIASNGAEALTLCQENSFDLIFMDEQMPVMDGNEAMEAIREYEKQNNLTHVPIVALTANVIKGSKEKAITNGYDAFLGKPIVVSEMNQIFAKFLESSEYRGTKSTRPQSQQRHNLDLSLLSEALMLEKEQIDYLLAMYEKKMEQLLENLESEINDKNWDDIKFTAHSIKGSSTNFRFEDLSRLAYTIEQSAMAKDEEFDFNEAFEVLQTMFQKKFPFAGTGI